MALTFSDGDFKKMTDLQLELSRVLVKAKEQRVEAALAAFACIRCARTLLDQYPEAGRMQLVEMVNAFLRHDDVVSEDTNTVRIFQ